MTEESKNDIVIFQSPDGKVKLNINLKDENLWLSQDQIAQLFNVDRSVITKHIQNILETQELSESSTCANFAQVQKEGKREVTRNIKHYNLDMIISIGYRVNSIIATRFRQWATRILKEFMIKGFAMDDERLKEPKRWDYFDELLERIREIRASEKRFYQKVRDLFVLSADYRDNDQETEKFFATVQNKMLFTVTGKTAAELIVDRADPNSPNMGLTTWKASRVRKADVIVAKNYLNHEEVSELNRIVTMFLDYAEDQARRRKQVKIADWVGRVDRFLEFNERDILKNAGEISREEMKQIAHSRYEEFDTNRRKQEALEADQEDIKLLEDLETEIKRLKDNEDKSKGMEE